MATPMCNDPPVFIYVALQLVCSRHAAYSALVVLQSSRHTPAVVQYMFGACSAACTAVAVAMVYTGTDPASSGLDGYKLHCMDQNILVD